MVIKYILGIIFGIISIIFGIKTVKDAITNIEDFEIARKLILKDLGICIICIIIIYVLSQTI